MVELWNLLFLRSLPNFLSFFLGVKYPEGSHIPSWGKGNHRRSVPWEWILVSRGVNLDLRGTYFQIQQITIGSEKGQATYWISLMATLFFSQWNMGIYPIFHTRKIHVRNQKNHKICLVTNIWGGGSGFRFPRSTPYEVSLNSRFFLCRKANRPTFWPLRRATNSVHVEAEWPPQRNNRYDEVSVLVLEPQKRKLVTFLRVILVVYIIGILNSWVCERIPNIAR